MSYRDDALKRLDVLSFFAAQGIVLRRLNDTEHSFLCPFHEDHTASANVNASTGLWFCHACSAKGTPIDLLMRRDGLSFRDALTKIGVAAGMEPPRLGINGGGPPTPATRDAAKPSAKLTEEHVEEWHASALRNADLMRWFREKRGYAEETIVRWRLGWDGFRVTIPIRDEKGKLVNVRRYKRDSSTVAGKMIGLETGMNAARLFPLELPLPEEIILVEGEWDTILMHQQGFAEALTVTSGAGIWKPEFTPHFEGRHVTILYDNDEAGRKGAQRVAAILSATATVFIAQIPNLPDKGDPTDFFVEQARSVEELRGIILDAPPYVAAAAVLDEPEAVKVALHAASHAQYRGRRIEVDVTLSGKTMTPYTIPGEFEFVCGMNNKRFCGACPMMEVAGHRHVVVNASDPATLALVNVTAPQQYNALRALARAHPQCTYGQPKILGSVNVEELRLIAEVNGTSSAIEEGESEYVNRTGYFMGHGLLPNRGYKMRGYTHPHPKTQATVHVINEAIPSQDNISAFVMTPELNEQLRIFEGDPTLAWQKVYDDLRLHVHRIQGRLDMQIAFDLIWHSAIDFYFNDAYVRRGWVEALIIGDSGQGKTEMAVELRKHYTLGERVQAESASIAGLLGGLDKMGESWMLSWGKLPLNDKRLVIVDETQGLPAAAIEALSDVRATGVAEITKIRTERTHSRTRIAWLANPPTGRTLAAHNQGVIAIKELFKKPEDIRRLDFAITVATGEVDAEHAINVRHAALGEPIYTSDLCRSLVLWAWSRRPDQIVFSSDATDAILAAATVMGRAFHASIPLVEPADQRLKIARLAVAAAARVHSTDETGEKIVVEPEHVEFVVEFLNRAYTARSMSYGEYSGQQRGAETLAPDTADEIRRTIDEWYSSESATAFFRQAVTFKRTDLVDAVGWDDIYAKMQIKYLMVRQMVRSVRDGYVKTPIFIALLRSLSDEPVTVDAIKEGEPF